MVVVPAPTPVARPLASMVATERLDEVQLVCPVTSPVPPFGKVPVAENCWVVPGWMLVLAGLILTPTTSFESRKNSPQVHPVTKVSSTTASTVAGRILLKKFCRCIAISSGWFAHSFHDRTMPSFFIRKWSVVRFIPSRAAAPCGPATTQFVSFKIDRMCSRSASLRVLPLVSSTWGAQ